MRQRAEKAYGNLILIKHGRRLCIRPMLIIGIYGRGVAIRCAAGQVIANSGRTGNVNAPQPSLRDPQGVRPGRSRLPYLRS